LLENGAVFSLKSTIFCSFLFFQFFSLTIVLTVMVSGWRGMLQQKRRGSQQVSKFCVYEINGFVDYVNLFSSLMVDYFMWRLRVFLLTLFLFKMDKSIV